MKNFHLIYTLWTILFIFSCSKEKYEEEPPKNAKENLKIANQIVVAPFLISIDGGKGWRDLANGLPTDLLVSFIDTFEQALIIGTERQGLFISDKNRTHWKPFVKEFSTKKINALHVVGKDIFIGLYKEGIFRSKDKGKSWQSLNYDLPDLRVQAILKMDSAILAATDIGIFRLVNGKKKWEAVLEGEQVVSLNKENKKIVAGTTAGIFLSENRGKTWTNIHQSGAIHNTAILEGKIFGMYISNDLVVSDDWGKTWTLANYSPRIGSYLYEVVSVQNKLIMSNNYGIHQSSDDGKSWTLIHPRNDLFFFDLLVDGEIVYGGMRP